MIFGTYRRLARAGVLGISRRNADYLARYNPRHLYPLVDDKLKTKRLAETAGIAVPPLYHVLEYSHQIEGFLQQAALLKDFVIKPSRGSGGEGILVVQNHSRGKFRLIDGTVMEESLLAYHLSSILSGVYSLGARPDKIIVEYRVRQSPVFADISYQGVPDIRVIVLCGVPVMAMLRLPTRASHGKANLHQGAIGAGISMKSGKTLRAVQGKEIIEEHPDTLYPITDVQIPDWEGVLRLAARSSELTGLGYQGVDIVLDAEKGPLILEMNARPGLSIQLANQAGLLPRLTAVEHALKSLATAEEKINFARNNF